jgi:hypothetical protein
MKQTAAALIFLAALMNSSGLLAASPDEALCRGAYPVLLMTPQECRHYLHQVKSLRSRGQIGALDALQRQHAELLQERAAACPCIENQTYTLPAQQVALIEPDC